MGKGFHSQPGKNPRRVTLAPAREACHYLAEFGYKHTQLDENRVEFYVGSSCHILEIRKVSETEVLYVSISRPHFLTLNDKEQSKKALGLCNQISRRMRGAKVYVEQDVYISATASGFFFSLEEAWKVFPQLLGAVCTITSVFLALQKSRIAKGDSQNGSTGEAG